MHVFRGKLLLLRLRAGGDQLATVAPAFSEGTPDEHLGDVGHNYPLLWAHLNLDHLNYLVFKEQQALLRMILDCTFARTP